MKVKLGFQSGLMVHSNWQARGIALLWDSATEVDLISYSQIYIGVQVNEGGQPKRRLTGFYGHSEVSQKVLSWNLLCWLSKNPLSLGYAQGILTKF